MDERNRTFKIALLFGVGKWSRAVIVNGWLFGKYNRSICLIIGPSI